MNYFYTIDGRYVPRELALRAMQCPRRLYYTSQRGETRTYFTNDGKLTVWVWPFGGANA